MRRFAITMAALAAVAVAGCASSSSPGPASGAGGPSTPAASGSPAAQTGTITVFAAASLKETFTQLGKQFQAAHAGDTAKFSFGAETGASDPDQQRRPPGPRRAANLPLWQLPVVPPGFPAGCA